MSESKLEQERRLLTMAEDDGESWDLSDNDRAACRAGAKAMERERHAMLRELFPAGGCADAAPAPLEPPPDTFTPLMWATLNEDEKWMEYVRVRQRLGEK